MKNKKVAVTGGLGFIGSHLVETLCQENDVVIIDDQSTGSIDNIKHLNLENISLDLGNITKIDLNKSLEGCDYVFHHAAMASVPASVSEPLKCNNANITGTLRVLLAAQQNNVSKLVFASSSAVYGDNTNFPLNEDTPIKSISPYALSKATGEMYCQLFTDIYDLSTVSLRYFNIFGPRQNPNSEYAAVIPHFITSLLNNKSPIIYGDGEQSRDFIYVKNIVKANILAAKSKQTGIFNIAMGTSTTINQLVEIINEVIGKDIKPIHAEPRSGDIKHSLADIEKSKKSGFIPESRFIDDLKETVNWFVDNWDS